MEYQLPPNLDPTQDMCEIGLMAAASPEFADALVRALLNTAARENVSADQDPGSQTCAPAVYNVSRG